MVVDTGGLVIVVLMTAPAWGTATAASRCWVGRRWRALSGAGLGDGASSRRMIHLAARALRLLVQVVTKSAGERGFAALSRR